MTLSVCLMTSDPRIDKGLRAILARTGLSVWTSPSAEVFESSKLRSGTLCLVIAIPGLGGLELLETLRAIGIETPAILVADPAEPLPAKRLIAACVLDTLYTPVQTRELLGWIECVCVTRMILSREHLLQLESRRRRTAPQDYRNVA